MKSHTTRSFRKLLAKLPAAARDQAREGYRLFRLNPSHPGLKFKKVHADPAIYSVRVGIHYRAVGAVDGNDVVWFWIGAHAGYDKLLEQL